MRRSPLRVDCPAVLVRPGRSGNSLRSLRSRHSDTPSQVRSRGALPRAARAPCAPRRRIGAPQRVRTALCDTARGVRRAARHRGACKAADGPSRRRISRRPRSAAPAAARGSAPRVLTHRDCPSTANEVSGASFAVGRRREHRRGASVDVDPSLWTDPRLASGIGLQADPVARSATQRLDLEPPRGPIRGLAATAHARVDEQRPQRTATCACGPCFLCD